MKPLRNMRLMHENTEVGPLVTRGVPRFKLVGKPCLHLFFAKDDTGTYVVDSYDVAHSVPQGMLVNDGALLARLASPDDTADPVPLGDIILTEWRAHTGPGLALPDGRRSDDVRDGIATIHEERIVALGPDVPRSDDLRGRLMFGVGPDTPTLFWGGRRLRFVPWARALAVVPE